MPSQSPRVRTGAQDAHPSFKSTTIFVQAKLLIDGALVGGINSINVITQPTGKRLATAARADEIQVLTAISAARAPFSPVRFLRFYRTTFRSAASSSQPVETEQQAPRIVAVRWRCRGYISPHNPTSRVTLRAMMSAATSQDMRFSHVGLTSSPIIARLEVNWISGTTANGNCRESTT